MIDVSQSYLKRLYRPDPKRFVVTPERIEAVLTEKQRLHKARIETAISMYCKGYSHADIAKRLGVCERQAALWTRATRKIDKQKFKKAQKRKGKA
jgi:hypothetical protein